MKYQLQKFPYKYMEYEKVLMLQEIKKLIGVAQIEETKDGFTFATDEPVSEAQLQRLTYIESYCINGTEWKSTEQSRLESTSGVSLNRQHTRYSTHGLHEYKGKFNPQIVHAIVNLMEISPSDRILDPFVGSGTTLVECAHLGIKAMGVDINPFAAFLANTKISALKLNVNEAENDFKIIMENIDNTISNLQLPINARLEYLKHWLPDGSLYFFEAVLKEVSLLPRDEKNFFLTVASDLIRDYSNQEPKDLRIRKRITPFPEVPIKIAFSEKIKANLRKIQAVQCSLPNIQASNVALNFDVQSVNPFLKDFFDGAITSPPYVTALPYIDTQRISLVWLGLCDADAIRRLEASLIGSRDFISNEKILLNKQIDNNQVQLPTTIINLIREMKASLNNQDGFRRQAVPALTYRYFAGMKKMFLNTRDMLSDSAPFALIVGHNKTILGGKQYNLDTPYLLSLLAESVGWKVNSIVPLQTYKRYGLNQKNAINTESLIMLENKK